MGLAGFGNDNTGVTPPTGELAQLMQDEGTNVENAAARLGEGVPKCLRSLLAADKHKSSIITNV